MKAQGWGETSVWYFFRRFFYEIWEIFGCSFMYFYVLFSHIPLRFQLHAWRTNLYCCIVQWVSLHFFSFILYPQRMEVPSPGIESKPKLWPVPSCSYARSFNPLCWVADRIWPCREATHPTAPQRELLTGHPNHLGILPNCRCRFKGGPEILHFHQVPRWCWSCWCGDHTLKSKDVHGKVTPSPPFQELC